MSGDTKGFYLGKVYDLADSMILEEAIHYDPADLTTHGVITGMTGSGKTGLGLILLEEAARKGIPAILIDPKGDLTNHLLHFPENRPEDFKPWLDRDAARRAGKSLDEAAEETAGAWRKGLAGWGLDQTHLKALSDGVDYAVFTPGSDAGLPVSILASLSAPEIPWEGNKEILREKISGTVTAILGLIGLRDVDPVRAREHILLSNIFESAWREGADLDMTTLITQVQSPPFEKLGVFSVDKFFPEKDRIALAMQLNNFLAAPAFQTWMEGQALDIKGFLYSADGKPRHSVFYLAHLNDEERMFFVTLLYGTIETWMRTQKGSSGLRALVYFDEIAGYLPPVASPPSKDLILRLLKQARAFGIGLVLATQNPVDLDYKALSNAGTWWIGKLQTEQDKARLLDGLEGAAPGMDRQAFDRMISQLDKRVFLLHNVHEDEPHVFHTRWAMNFLAGPITRTQIPAVNALVGAKITTASAVELASPDEARETDSPGQAIPPAVPGSVPVYYLPADRGPSAAMKEAGRVLTGEPPQPKMVYRPALIGQARVRFISRKYDLHHEEIFSVRLDDFQRQGRVNWQAYLTNALDPKTLNEAPLPEASYEAFASPLDDAGLMKNLESDFQDWIYRTRKMMIRINEPLDRAAGPDVSETEFRRQCQAAADQKLAEEIEALQSRYEKKLDGLEEKLLREQNNLAEDKQELGHRRMEELGTGLENMLSLFGRRRRRITTSLTKRRMTAKARSDVTESEQAIERLEAQMAEMEAELTAEASTLKETWARVVEDVVQLPVAPYKKDIFVEMFGVLWQPYYAFPQEAGWLTLPAFEGDHE